MKRVELGALSDGKYGLRVSRPGHDVTDHDAPLLFDSDLLPASLIFKGSLPAEHTERTVRNFQLPGFPGTTTTTLRSSATFVFPFALPFIPYVRTFKKYRLEDGPYNSDEFQNSSGVSVSTSQALVNTTEQRSGEWDYEDVPTHYFLVFNFPLR